MSSRSHRTRSRPLAHLAGPFLAAAAGWALATALNLLIAGGQ